MRYFRTKYLKIFTSLVIKEPQITISYLFFFLKSLRHVQLCNPRDCSPPGPSVHGISQTRVLEWAATSSSRASSPPRDRTHVSCTGRWVLYHWEARVTVSYIKLTKVKRNENFWGSSLVTQFQLLRVWGCQLTPLSCVPPGSICPPGFSPSAKIISTADLVT